MLCTKNIFKLKTSRQDDNVIRFIYRVSIQYKNKNRLQYRRLDELYVASHFILVKINTKIIIRIG